VKICADCKHCTGDARWIHLARCSRFREPLNPVTGKAPEGECYLLNFDGHCEGWEKGSRLHIFWIGLL